MGKLFAAIAKELRLLSRDKTGLLVLFLMPSILVIVITLVQQNVLELSGMQKTELLLNDHDHGPFSASVRGFLEAAQIDIKDFSAKSDKDFQRQITDGRYQAGVIIPAHTSTRLTEELQSRLANRGHLSAQGQSQVAPLYITFDPAAMAGYRVAMVSRLRLAARAAEMELMADQLAKGLSMAAEHLRENGAPPVPSASALKKTFTHSLTTISEQATSTQSQSIDDIFHPVNRNVPAWALFGMFFTAIPIAGGILAERRSGIGIRLAAMPVSALQLMLGKVAAYLLICCCQFLLIVLIGMYLFPQLGLPAFTLPQNPYPLVPVILACGLAACGFGTFLGSLCRSYEQASTLGSTTVVAAAALGGVMVPVYAMPHVMQRISTLSPLNWGVDAFLDLLVRGHGISATLPDLTRLLVFAAVMILFSRRPRLK